jgi:hypothetical protein
MMHFSYFKTSVMQIILEEEDHELGEVAGHQLLGHQVRHLFSILRTCSCPHPTLDIY